MIMVNKFNLIVKIKNKFDLKINEEGKLVQTFLVEVCTKKHRIVHVKMRLIGKIREEFAHFSDKLLHEKYFIVQGVIILSNQPEKKVYSIPEIYPTRLIPLDKDKSQKEPIL
uniref:hypothetical protein n=1 Tax=Rhodaphanes brevistipitata TaxID=446136 RepID=UPI001FCD6D63|nr:hypothetical protein MW432_pgp161 [Rhodaphanes brevistipitata]UNJ18420.1 hypothetical protein [Rhodaphanes brevistipitata]